MYFANSEILNLILALFLLLLLLKKIKNKAEEEEDGGLPGLCRAERGSRSEQSRAPDEHS